MKPQHSMDIVADNIKQSIDRGYNDQETHRLAQAVMPHRKPSWFRYAWRMIRFFSLLHWLKDLAEDMRETDQPQVKLFLKRVEAKIAQLEKL